MIPFCRGVIPKGGAVNDEEFSVLGKFGMQRKSQQTTLIEARVQLGQARSHVEKRLLGAFAVLANGVDSSSLVGDKKARTLRK